MLLRVGSRLRRRRSRVGFKELEREMSCLVCFVMHSERGVREVKIDYYMMWDH